MLNICFKSTSIAAITHLENILANSFCKYKPINTRHILTVIILGNSWNARSRENFRVVKRLSDLPAPSPPLSIGPQTIYDILTITEEINQHILTCMYNVREKVTIMKQEKNRKQSIE